MKHHTLDSSYCLTNDSGILEPVCKQNKINAAERKEAIKIAAMDRYNLWKLQQVGSRVFQKTLHRLPA